eukprot:12951775-Alexandrium_andersonii.AAC.1
MCFAPCCFLLSKCGRLGRKIAAYVCENNQACFQIAKSGANPTMRYLERTHRCDVQRVHEIYLDGALGMYNIETDAQAADIFTKPFKE